MDAVHPENPLQPADQRPPRDAPRGQRGRPTHSDSEAPTPATSRQPTTGPPHTRANSPPPTVETIHPSHTPPLTTRGRRNGATTRPRCRDPPTRGPRERHSPRVAHTRCSLHHWAHSTVGRHPQAPHDHTPLVATLQSHKPRPRGPQVPRHTDPARPTYSNTPGGRPRDRAGLPHTARGPATGDNPPHQTWTRCPPPPSGRPPHNTTPPYHTAPPSPTRGHGTPQPTNTGTKPRHADSAPHRTRTSPGNPAHLTPAQRQPPATTRTADRGNTTGQDSHQRAATHHNQPKRSASPYTGARSRTGRRTCPEHQHHTPTVP